MMLREPTYPMPSRATRLAERAQVLGWKCSLTWTEAHDEFPPTVALRFFRPGRIPVFALWAEQRFDFAVCQDPASYPLRTLKDLTTYLLENEPDNDAT